ncbi:MAG: DNA alkylation repair protein [Bdellovibrionales bacterium]
MNDDKPTAFKHWINQKTVKKYAQGIAGEISFDAKNFYRATEALETLELRDRARLLAEAFQQLGPRDYPKVLTALWRAVELNKIRGFELWPVSEYIQTYGHDHFDESFQAMIKLTKIFTSEFAVRPFLNRSPDATLTALTQLIKDEDENVRRWVSEGTRPRLPWGERLPAFVKDPTRNLKLLEHLKFDASLFVRKSVANHLNDVAKDHPDIVIKTLARWQKLVPPKFEKEFAFIRHRALRTLVKAGNPAALKLMGVQQGHPDLSVGGLKISTPKVKLGKALEFQFNIRNKGQKKTRFLVDYAVLHRKANGELVPKVFKLKSGWLEPGAILNVVKSHKIKPITTRKYYPGEQGLEILLNGKPKAKARFTLAL